MNDLTEQWMSIFQKLGADWDIVADSWDDCVHDAFQKYHVQLLKDSLAAYLQGSYGHISVRGKGLIDLVRLIDECGEKLSAMTGVPFAPVNPAESQGNEYIDLGEPMLRYDDRIKDKFRNEHEEGILAHESEDITFKRQHPYSIQTILDI